MEGCTCSLLYLLIFQTLNCTADESVSKAKTKQNTCYMTLFFIFMGEVNIEILLNVYPNVHFDQVIRRVTDLM